MTPKAAARWIRAFAVVAALVALTFGALSLYVRAWIGVPDGSVTDRDRAVERLLAVQGAVGFGFAGGFAVLGWVRRRWTARALLATAAAFVIVAGGLVAWCELGFLHLDDGQGG